MGSSNQTDILIIGGGLAGALLAHRLVHQRPELSIILLEAGDDYPRHATWSFHRSDISKANWEWLEPLVSREWPGYTVRFPDYTRELLGSSYCSIRSAEFFDRLDNIREHTKFGAQVSSITQQSIYLKNGNFFSGRVVIDARGWNDTQSSLCGWQKFVGLDLELESEHGLTHPFLMDADCEQKDGYRFFYVLPWSPNRVLIEDTRYSGTADFDVDEYTEELVRYAQDRAWEIRRIERVESSALPIPLLEPERRGNSQIPSIGMAGGFFHRVTGYSLPWAVRIAGCLSRMDDYTPSLVLEELRKFRLGYKRMDGFGLLLNRMLFCAAEPRERRKIFAHFYRLPEGLIQRFYTGHMTILDMGRVLVGKPPVRIQRALKVARAKEKLTIC